MTKWLGLALGGAMLAACGHAVPTGNYANNYNTPTGYATAQHTNYLNPDVNPPHARVPAQFQRQPPENAPAPPEPVQEEGPSPGAVESPTTP
jgi:hypothetical protein